MEVNLKRYQKYVIALVLILIFLFVAAYFYYNFEEVMFDYIHKRENNQFNKMLSVCNKFKYFPELHDSYSIEGIKDGKCIVRYSVIGGAYSNITNQRFTARKEYICSLPYEVYSNPAGFNLASLLELRFCMLNKTIGYFNASEKWAPQEIDHSASLIFE